jgi:hypothetical protein
MRVEEPELAARADEGELVMLIWKGGVEEKLKIEKKPGTLKYLATWLGLRGEDLDIELEEQRVVVCSKTGQAVIFNAAAGRPYQNSGSATSPAPAKDRVPIGSC